MGSGVQGPRREAGKGRRRRGGRNRRPGAQRGGAATRQHGQVDPSLRHAWRPRLQGVLVSGCPRTLRHDNWGLARSPRNGSGPDSVAKVLSKYAPKCRPRLGLGRKTAPPARSLAIISMLRRAKRLRRQARDPKVGILKTSAPVFASSFERPHRRENISEPRSGHRPFPSAMIAKSPLSRLCQRRSPFNESGRPNDCNRLATMLACLAWHFLISRAAPPVTRGISVWHP